MQGIPLLPTQHGSLLGENDPCLSKCPHTVLGCPEGWNPVRSTFDQNGGLRGPPLLRGAPLESSFPALRGVRALGSRKMCPLQGSPCRKNLEGRTLLRHQGRRWTGPPLAIPLRCQLDSGCLAQPIIGSLRLACGRLCRVQSGVAGQRGLLRAKWLSENQTLTRGVSERLTSGYRRFCRFRTARRISPRLVLDESWAIGGLSWSTV